MSSSELIAGAALGEYRISERVGEFATGTVYRASQPALDRDVLLHVASAAPGGLEAERFMGRARALAGVSHPSVPEVYETGAADGMLFASMRFAPGRPLAEVAAEGPVPPERAVDLVDRIVDGIEALRRSGDQARFAPEAVLVTESDATLLPLSVALGAGSESTPESVGALLKSLVGERPGALRSVLRHPARFGSSTELAQAARAALGAPQQLPARRKPAVLAAVGVGSVLVLVAVAVLLRDEGGPQRVSPNALPARIVATIPVGGQPGSIAFHKGSLWVATTQRQLVRIDARTNQVVGAPLRFSSGRGESNLTLRAGTDALYVSDGAAGLLVRIDPQSGRITKRVRFPGAIDSLLPVRSRVWVGRSPSPESSRAEIVPLDTRTLKQIGAGVAVGSGPLDLEADDGAVLVSGAGDGTITRVEPGRPPLRRLVAGLALDSTLAAGKLWVPGRDDGVLTVVDPGLTRPPLRALHLGIVTNAIKLGDAVWVVRKDGVDPGSESSLLRLDPRSERVQGRALRLGDVGWPQAGGDSLWFGAPSRRAVLRVSASTETPGRRAAERAPEGVLRSGPLEPGRLSTVRDGVAVSLSVTDRSWVGVAPREYVELRHFEARTAAVSVAVPEVLLDEKGGAKPARAAAQVERHLRTHAHIDVKRSVAERVGGVPARTFSLRLGRRAPPAPFCRNRCAPLWAKGNITGGVEGGSAVEISVLEMSDRPVLVVAEWSTSRGAALAGALRDTLKLTAAR